MDINGNYMFKENKETPSLPLNRRMRESRSELAYIMPNEEEEDEVNGDDGRRNPLLLRSKSPFKGDLEGLLKINVNLCSKKI